MLTPIHAVHTPKIASDAVRANASHVADYVRSIYRKLDAATRLEAVLAGVKLGELDRSWLFAEREL